MSIEAMSKAYEALNKSRPFDADNARMQRDAMDALRTAIQQAESEPVAFGIRASNTGRICQFVSSDNEEEVAQLGEYRKGSVVPLYTHPAPGAPDEVVRDAERFRWLRSEHERNDPICHLTWKRNMDRSEWRWVNTAVIDSSIDAAMTASQAQKGQP